jgi:hypothetical protein
VQLARDARALGLAHLEHRDRELALLLVRAPDLGLGAHARADVAQDHGEELLVVDRCLRDRSFDRELGAVRAQGRQRDSRTHAARGVVGAAELLDVPAMDGAEPLGEEAVERPAERIRGGAAEHLLGRGVEQDDALARVDGDDRVHRGPDDRVEPLLAGAGLPLEQSSFGSHALGDVAQDDRQELFASHRRLRYRRLDPELAAVGTQRPKRRLEPHASRRLPGAAEPLQVRAVDGPEPLGDETLERAAERLRGAAAEHLLGRGVEHDDALGSVDRDDCVHRRLNDRVQPRRAFADVGAVARVALQAPVDRDCKRQDESPGKGPERAHDQRVTAPPRQRLLARGPDDQRNRSQDDHGRGDAESQDEAAQRHRSARYAPETASYLSSPAAFASSM